METPDTAPTLRVVPGELETRNAPTRLVLPTSKQPAWPPFSRAGEVITSQGRAFPPHAHENEEVLTFLVEGVASYVVDTLPAESLAPGSARLISTSSKIMHTISPARRGPIRWFNLVVENPGFPAGKPRLQASEPPTSPRYDEDAQVRPLVGDGGPMTSASGFEAAEINFVVPSTTFRRVGHSRKALVYGLAGHGAVDGRAVDAGEAALVEGVAGIAVEGDAGFRVIVATAPR